MAKRENTKQSDHDAAVEAAKNIYEGKGRHVWINPGSNKNKSWSGKWIDVIVTEEEDSTEAWVIEIETEESVSEAEASGQWIEYDTAYSSWYLAVPKDSKSDAEALIRKHKIKNCTILTWSKNEKGIHTFWGLPGIPKKKT